MIDQILQADFHILCYKMVKPLLSIYGASYYYIYYVLIVLSFQSFNVSRNKCVC